jgi:hypothetical protein
LRVEDWKRGMGVLKAYSKSPLSLWERARVRANGTQVMNVVKPTGCNPWTWRKLPITTLII